jgi:hypothetical protein
MPTAAPLRRRALPALLLPLLLGSRFASALTFAVAMLVVPPASRAAPDAQFLPALQTQSSAVGDSAGNAHLEMAVRGEPHRAFRPSWAAPASNWALGMTVRRRAT